LDRTAIAGIVLGGFAATTIIESFPGFAHQAQHVGAVYALPYLLVLASLAACAVLVIGQGLMPPGLNTAEKVARVETIPRFETASHRRFWADLGKSFLAIVLLSGIAYACTFTVSAMALAFLAPLVILAFLIGPIIVFVAGIVLGRPGLAAAPAIILLIIVGFRSAKLVAVG
jgi:hypothetical protein